MKRQKQVIYFIDTSREQSKSRSLFSDQSVAADVSRKRRTRWVILLMMGMVWLGYKWEMSLVRKESGWEHLYRYVSSRFG